MKGNEYNKIRGRQVEFVTEDVIEERVEDNSIPLRKIKDLERNYPSYSDLNKAVEKAVDKYSGYELIVKNISDLQKELYELVIDVKEEDRYKLVSYAKEHLPIVTVVRDDGKQIFCSVIYNKDNKTITVEWNDAFTGYIYVL